MPSTSCPLTSTKSKIRPRFVQTTICAVGAALCLTPSASVADVLSQYTFGTATPAILTPTAQSPYVAATPVTNGAGVNLDLLSNQTPAPASAPWLRVVPTTAANSGADAVAKNAYYQFSLTANAGSLLNLASLAFGVMNGGAGTRGYEVRTSLDNYAATLQTAVVTTVRPNFTPVTISLNTPTYQGLSTISFRIYTYANGTGSVEYDNVVVDGVAALLPFTGYTWTGSANGNWNTTAANWSGPGTTYVEPSQVLFNDTGAIKDVTVTPSNLNPVSVAFDNSAAPYTLSGSALTVTGVLSKSGTSTVTLNNSVTTSSVALSAGTLTVGPTGSLTSANIVVSSGGTLQVQPSGSLGASSGLQVNGNLVLNNGTQSLATLSGANTGVTTLTDTTLTVTGGSIYAGAITGNGGLVKTTAGALVLNNNTNNFSGGIVVNGGIVQLDSVNAAGTGSVTVNAGASLNLGANVANSITIAGGTLGASAAGVAAPANVAVSAASTVKTYNAATNAASNDIIITGQLLGSGNINLLTLNGNAPDSQAFRLRGPSSTYSGTITVNQSAKFELQNGGASGSPMGTGTLVMVGGTPTGTAANGTFSIVNLRNNFTGDTNFGNPVRISGTGSAFFNMVGGAPAGSTTSMGPLQIGNGQTVAAVSTGAAHTLGFSSVSLTGGVATFTPQIPGNTNYVAVNNIRLGAISETVAGSGIQMNGAATLTLAGINTYTGATSLLSGTTVLAAGGSLGTTSSITVATGATFNAQPAGAFVLAGPQTLTVNGTMTGDVVVSGVVRGSGTLNGVISAISGGVIAPGNSAGILSTKNLSLEAGSILQMELAKAIAGSPPVAGLDYDRLSVSDASAGLTPTVSLGGNLALTIGAGLQTGDVFTLIVNQASDAVIGTFSGLNQGTIFSAGGQQFQISYGDDSATAGFELNGGNDVSLLVVPEPASALLLLGGAALCTTRRRRSTDGDVTSK